MLNTMLVLTMFLCHLYMQGIVGYASCVNYYMRYFNAFFIIIRLNTSPPLIFASFLTRADNTWHACGTLPWHVEPTRFLFVAQNVEDVRLCSLVMPRRWREVRRCFVGMLGRCIGFRVDFFMRRRCGRFRRYVLRDISLWLR